MNKQAVIEQMCASGVLPVFRTQDITHLIPVTKALYDSGMPCVEYTMTMPRALEMIKKGTDELPKDLYLGAGTIVDGETVDKAVQAGASFIASPGISEPMIAACVRNGVVSVVGAVTPTEIMRALDLGADIIKVFCAGSVGPVFFENMPGPFPGIRMMAAGGMTLNNLKDYIKAGAEVVTMVPNLAEPEAYAVGDCEPIARTAKKWVDAVKAARQA
jgi:2-dehydro-3-deoxyphosphogluconate aldolase / (4S)-4-hydroxy-2-oxoglutarate aldolase